MQTAPASHDELFVAADNRSLLIMPFIESRGNWNMRNEFPRWTDNSVSPGVVAQVNNLIDRYLQNTSHPEWADKWARVYDREGQVRYAVVLIHASSNRLSASEHAAFAEGFDLVADEVYAAKGVRVGFFIDALPPDSPWAPGDFKPSPELTGPYLVTKASLLGIQCFIPEIWADVADDTERLAWKRDFSQRWSATGIPFLMDVCPGYDAHLVFPGSVYYGFTIQWRQSLTAMVEDFGHDGLVYNSWNGYTEGMVAMPTTEHGDTYFQWLTDLIKIFPPPSAIRDWQLY
jgi:hypothetical protein